MSDLINELNLHGHTKVPDHSLVQFFFDFLLFDIKIPEYLNGSQPKQQKYNFSHIPASFLNDEKSFDLLNEIIVNKEHAISNQADIDSAYEFFLTLLQNEMEDKLKASRTSSKQSSKRHKSRAKPFWSDELQELWSDVCTM